MRLAAKETFQANVSGGYTVQVVILDGTSAPCYSLLQSRKAKQVERFRKKMPMLKNLLKTDDNTAALVLRLTLGCVIFAHGAQKVLGWYGGPGAEKTLQNFSTAMGFSSPLTLLVMATEFLGPIALFLGFFTRVSAFAIAVNLGTCAYLNHLKHGFFMNWFGQQKGEGFEFHILVIGIALALMITGGGIFSFDRALYKKKTGNL